MSPNPKSRARRKKKHAKKVVAANALEDPAAGMDTCAEGEGSPGSDEHGVSEQHVSLTATAMDKLALASADSDSDVDVDQDGSGTSDGGRRARGTSAWGKDASTGLAGEASKAVPVSPRQRLRRAGLHPREPKPGCRTSGTVPNVHYCVLGTEELRLRREYYALPPVEQMALGHPSSYRFVRQDTRMWDELHQGRLTCSKLAACLGFYEPMALRELRLPKSWVSHAPLVSVYHHLLDPLLVPEGDLHRMFATPEDEAARNNALVRTYNGDAGGGEPTVYRALPGGEPDAASLMAREGHRGRGRSRNGAGASADQTGAWQNGSAALGPGHKSLGRAPPPPRLSREEEKRRGNISTAVAARGISSVRMAWGKAQEAASLFSLAKHVEGGNARVEEVGLCVVDVEADIPKEWGIQTHFLPPLGASPDGLLRHWNPQGAGSSLHTSHDAPISGLFHPLSGSNTLVGNGSHANGSKHVNGMLDGSGHVVEVIEVKNRCPFQHEKAGRQSGTKRSCKPHYTLSDADLPTDHVHATYVPQLQMEMLAAKASSAVLVVNTATKGMYLFRMHRDDEYLRLMLQFISLLYARHVLKKTPPPNNIFTDNKDYKKFLKLTCSLARSITFLERVDEPACISTCCDHRLFVEV